MSTAENPTAELELCRDRIRRLQAVVDASALVNSSLELDHLGRHIVELAARLVGAERGSLFLADHQAGTLTALVAQGLDGRELRVPMGAGIVGTVAETGRAIIIADPYSDPRFDRSVDRASGFVTRSLLTVPVRDRDGGLVAVLQLLNSRTGRFSEQDIEFLEELGVAFAIGLTAARQHRQIVERERLAEEVRLAAEIQTTLRPRSLADVPGLELKSLVRPCLEIGGDYFDIIPRAGGKRWWLVMADISGKGVSAGLIASNVQAYLWSRCDDRRSLQRIVAEGNDLLYGLTRGRKYATMMLVEWSPARRTVSWVGAGHPPIVLLRGEEATLLESTGCPIGLLPGRDYAKQTVRLKEGDQILLYTDGVTEAAEEPGTDEFGVERLVRSVRGLRRPGELLEAILGALEKHLDGAPFTDDVTLLCARHTSGAAAAAVAAGGGTVRVEAERS